MTDDLHDNRKGRRQSASRAARWASDAPREDTIAAKVRGPHSVFVYWQLLGPRSSEAWDELGDDCQWQLRVIDLSDNVSQKVVVRPEAGSQYVEVSPGRAYGFELAALGAGKMRTVCRTGPVRVPAAGPTAARVTGPARLIEPGDDAAPVGLTFEATPLDGVGSPGSSEGLASGPAPDAAASED